MIKVSEIDLLKYKSQIKSRKGNNSFELLDPVRKLWVNSTPEEWVRQLFISYLLEENIWSRGLLSVEKSFSSHNLTKRWDLVAFNKNMEAQILFEFKSPEVSDLNNALDQISIYSATIKAPFVILSNGMEHRIYYFNAKENSLKEGENWPEY